MKLYHSFVCLWYGRQDLNLHGNPLEPKSNVSANSTTPANIKLSVYADLLVYYKYFNLENQGLFGGAAHFGVLFFLFIGFCLTFVSSIGKIDLVYCALRELSFAPAFHISDICRGLRLRLIRIFLLIFPPVFGGHLANFIHGAVALTFLAMLILLKEVCLRLWT